MNKKDLASPELLHQLLICDFETGFLTWRRRNADFYEDGFRSAARSADIWNSRWAGRPALTANRTGYRAGQILKKSYIAHRVIWAMYTGAWPVGQIDHINGIRTDNRIVNLRDVSRQDNYRNASISKNNTSGALGVSWDARSGKWRAQITVDHKKKYLGTFSSKSEAVLVRKAAEAGYGFHPNHGRSSSAI